MVSQGGLAPILITPHPITHHPKLNDSIPTYQIPRLLAYPYKADTIPAGEQQAGIVLVNPLAKYRDMEPEVKSHPFWADGMSWIYLALAVLFCVTGLKFKGSSKYLGALVSDLTDTRVRHNVFDDTVKETSLMVLLNLVWVASAGIMLWIGVDNQLGTLTGADSIGLAVDRPVGIGLCIGMAALYLALILLAYLVVGNVFSDARQTRLWVKGAASSVGLQGFLMFPIALVALNYPTWAPWLIIAAVAVFATGKLVFFYQGFRIFFTQISSWLLFLYYLCSLEIIPVILTYAATVGVCTSGLIPGMG